MKGSHTEILLKGTEFSVRRRNGRIAEILS
jgi:hypothetical protein